MVLYAARLEQDVKSFVSSEPKWLKTCVNNKLRLIGVMRNQITGIYFKLEENLLAFNCLPSPPIRLLRSPMSSRYYFNLTDGEVVIRDEEGILVSDVQAALVSALEVVRELRAEDPSVAAEWQGWRLEIVDEAGRVIESLSLDDPHSKNASRH
jgi:hypothetical protein